MSAIWPLLASRCSTRSHRSIAKESNGLEPGVRLRLQHSPVRDVDQMTRHRSRTIPLSREVFCAGLWCTRPSTSPEDSPRGFTSSAGWTRKRSGPRFSDTQARDRLIARQRREYPSPDGHLWRTVGRCRYLPSVPLTTYSTAAKSNLPLWRTASVVRSGTGALIAGAAAPFPRPSLPWHTAQ